MTTSSLPELRTYRDFALGNDDRGILASDGNGGMARARDGLESIF